MESLGSNSSNGWGFQESIASKVSSIFSILSSLSSERKTVKSKREKCHMSKPIIELSQSVPGGTAIDLFLQIESSIVIHKARPLWKKLNRESADVASPVVVSKLSTLQPSGQIAIDSQKNSISSNVILQTFNMLLLARIFFKRGM